MKLKQNELGLLVNRENLPRTAVAERIGITYPTLLRAMRQFPGPSTRAKICKYFGVTPESLWPDECGVPTTPAPQPRQAISPQRVNPDSTDADRVVVACPASGSD